MRQRDASRGGFFTLFDTPFGRCALAWNDVGLTSVRLPERSEALTRANLLARQPGAVECPADWPPFVVEAVAQIQAHLAGDAHDLRQVPLDLSGTRDFELKVYTAARAMAAGQTCTYGEMAHAIGEPQAMRAVGQALANNPWPLVVPCHRVVRAGGGLGGFSAPGRSETKRRLLLLELGMGRREGQLF